MDASRIVDSPGGRGGGEETGSEPESREGRTEGGAHSSFAHGAVRERGPGRGETLGVREVGSGDSRGGEFCKGLQTISAGLSGFFPSGFNPLPSTPPLPRESPYTLRAS